MSEALIVTIMVVVVAIAFDFVNGFHDAANSIATIVATGVLKPTQAVLWAASFNFVALFIFGTTVAKTVGSGMIAIDAVTPLVILSGLIGAVSWGLFTWWLSIPTSSTHSLLGAYAGAAMMNNVWQKGLPTIFDPIIVAGWVPTLIFIVAAPVIALTLAHTMMRVTLDIESYVKPDRHDKFFRHMQLVSSAFLSLMHGGNDAQKTAGIISIALVSGGLMTHFEVPIWILWMSYTTMAFGTFFGGWRIVRTMGMELTRLRPDGGFCAETSAGVAILAATYFDLPVSTTHATTGAILGVGAARRLTGVRWNLAAHIVWAWIFTLPAAATLGALSLLIATYIAHS